VRYSARGRPESASIGFIPANPEPALIGNLAHVYANPYIVKLVIREQGVVLPD
jgi:hypothetical protein